MNKLDKVDEASVQDMPNVVTNDDTVVKRIKVGDDDDWFESGKCTDCGAKHGEYHKENCDCERCPICGGQLLSCDCWKEYST